jgi:hypothetical protein
VIEKRESAKPLIEIPPINRHVNQKSLKLVNRDSAVMSMAVTIMWPNKKGIITVKTRIN